MDTIGKRIKSLRENKNLTQTELSEILGMKTYTTVSKWESDDNFPKGKDLKTLSQLFNVSSDYLLGLSVEKKENIKQNIKQNDLISNIVEISKKLKVNRQEKVVTYAKSELDEQNKENLVQLFSYNVQEKLSAGTGFDYEGNGSYDVAYSDKEYDYDFASWIFGDSMLPDYPNGDVALIKACPFEYSGEIYAVDWDGQSYIKKVYQEEKGLRLVSTNEKYSDKFAPFSEEPRIIGKVVASFTPVEK